MTNVLFMLLMLISPGSAEKSLHSLIAPKTINIAMPPPPAANTGYEHWDLYINKYKSMACSLSTATGIPASVLLAQGLFESDAGRSYVAMEANNHFGVKCPHRCKKRGHHVEASDDHENDLFRRFRSVKDAYIYQAAMLQRGRYADIKALSGWDWRKWCENISARGYATSGSYENFLTSIIENARLEAYDFYACGQSPHSADGGAVCIARSWRASD